MRVDIVNIRFGWIVHLVPATAIIQVWQWHTGWSYFHIYLSVAHPVHPLPHHINIIKYIVTLRPKQILGPPRPPPPPPLLLDSTLGMAYSPWVPGKMGRRRNYHAFLMSQLKSQINKTAIGSILVSTGTIPRSKSPGQLYAGGSTDLGTSALWKGINHSNLLPRHIRLIL